MLPTPATLRWSIRAFFTGDRVAATRGLKAGGSVDPLDALKIAGVDMTTPDAVVTTFGVMAEYVERIGAKTGKTSFHSFRHNFEDACRNGGVQPHIMNALPSASRVGGSSVTSER